MGVVLMVWAPQVLFSGYDELAVLLCRGCVAAPGLMLGVLKGSGLAKVETEVKVTPVRLPELL